MRVVLQAHIFLLKMPNILTFGALKMMIVEPSEGMIFSTPNGPTYTFRKLMLSV